MDKQKAKTVVVTGKGGVGKTTFTAMLAPALMTRFGRVLIIDGDPDLNLNLMLNLPDPAATVADIKDEPLKAKDVRKSGKTAVGYLQDRLKEAGVISRHQIEGIAVDFMAMGVTKEHGCYCAVNNALAGVFTEIQTSYDLVLIDSPAGTEHLSRQRVKQADLFIVIQTPTSAARAVAWRIQETAARSDMTIGHTLVVDNQLPTNGIGLSAPARGMVVVESRAGYSQVALPYNYQLAISHNTPYQTMLTTNPLLLQQVADGIEGLLNGQPTIGLPVKTAVPAPYRH